MTDLRSSVPLAPPDPVVTDEVGGCVQRVTAQVSRGGNIGLSAIAQRGGQPAHGQQDAALDQLVVVSGPVPPQQLDLQMVQRLEIREAVEYRARQRRVVGEQVVLSGDELVHADRALMLVENLVDDPPPQ